MNNPLCQKLLIEANNFTYVVVEKSQPYFIRGCGYLTWWRDKYHFGVTDDSSCDDQGIFAQEWMCINFTDEDIEKIEEKDKLWIYLK